MNYMDVEEKEHDKDLPGFGLAAFFIMILLVSILLNKVSGVLLEEGNIGWLCRLCGCAVVLIIGY
ncbi:hypothetical protein [Domibacillus iocasae]|uniref:Uncharacterized protein n=1 Tax=Domibacillus iocasae TaxID=1714016 RepID=A0A1E7DK01_9BACI|nr:hypothetical protein [Domibacillus iocasae]OES43406.1 hypothetical protein BA724_13345 [Domibacillus iocasae]